MKTTQSMSMSIILVILFVFSSCGTNAVDSDGFEESLPENVAISNNQLDFDGWSSSEIIEQLHNGEKAVTGRLFKKGNSMFTLEIIDTNVLPQLANAFPKLESGTGEKVMWNGQESILYPAPQGSYAMVQHREDGRIIRITGHGFAQRNDFIKAISLVAI